MAMLLTRRGLLHPCFVKRCSLGLFVSSGNHIFRLISAHRTVCFPDRNFDCFSVLGLLRMQYQLLSVKQFSTSFQPDRLCWEVNSHSILLRKLEIALKNHQIDEAWVTFNDFKNLYGFPTGTLLNRLIIQMAYASDTNWLQKACDLVLLLSKEKSDLLRPEVLTRLSLSLARAQKPVPASMVLRVMLEKENVPPPNILRLIVLHMVKTDIGTYLASNLLFQICDFYLRSSVNRCKDANATRPDTTTFNIVLDACLRFKESLKGQQIIELMSRTGVIADAHSITIIAQILEMNGQRDEIKKYKVYIDKVSAPFICHYRQFYDSLLSLLFKFDDIEAVKEFVLGIHSSRDSISVQKLERDMMKPCVVPIGSHNLRNGLKLQIMPELLHTDFILKVEKQELVIYRSGKLLLSNKSLSKLIIGHKRHDKIANLSKILLSIEKDYNTINGSTLCADVIDACIHLGWLETAHDILDDVEKSGSPLGYSTYMTLLTAYHDRGMSREASGLLRQMRKAGLFSGTSDKPVTTFSYSDSAAENSPFASKSNFLDALVREMRDNEKAIPSVVYHLNSSIYFFCKAKMIADALKTYRRMQEMKLKPTVHTFASLISAYSELESYRDITILWGEIKRRNLVMTRDLYELLLLNFLRGGYFERAMEIINHMKEQNYYIDKGMLRNEFLCLHRNLYKGLKASEARNEAQKKRLEYVKALEAFIGL